MLIKWVHIGFTKEREGERERERKKEVEDENDALGSR